MSAFSNDGKKMNHMMLSPCTKRSVLENLASQTRTSCLKEVSDVPFCGDGIVGPGECVSSAQKLIFNLELRQSQDLILLSTAGEVCDCGSVMQCLSARSCCVPSNGHGGINRKAKPCTSAKEHCSNKNTDINTTSELLR